MRVKTFALGVLEANCHIFWDPASKKALAIDVGGDAHKVQAFLEDKQCSLEGILLTHGHADHIGGAEALKALTGAPIAIHELDVEMLLDPQKNASAMLPGKHLSFEPDKLLKDGDTWPLGDFIARIHHTPGHTRGGICIEIEDYLATGDTLFQGSIGRTDLFGGDMQVMRKTLEKIGTWSNRLTVLPGHGPQTSLREEKRHNPYLSRFVKG